MASQSNIEFRVGLTILMAVVVLAGSLYWLQGYKLEHNSQLVIVRFADVGTLSVGDKVTVSGVHRGKVNKLYLTENGVEVELLIYQDVILKKDATFTIKNLGVMGERFVAINPGRDTALFVHGETVEGLYDIGIPEVMGKLGEMITELRNLVTSLKKTVASDSSLSKFNRTVSNFEKLSSSLSSMFERNEDAFDSTAQNFLNASEKMAGMLNRNSNLADSTFTRMNRTSIQLEKFVNDLDSLAITARNFADILENEDGTLQLLLEDRRLYDDLRQTADNIDDLILDIKSDPRKYINLKVELF